jgi:hypothetical protein
MEKLEVFFCRTTDGRTFVVQATSRVKAIIQAGKYGHVKFARTIKEYMNPEKNTLRIKLPFRILR